MMCFGLKERKRAKTNHCVIVLLDDTQLVHELHATSSGQDLLDVVFKHLNLLETSYFGLKYLEQAGEGAQAPPGERQCVWLDMDRSAVKQLRHANPMTVYFGVKYYASDPCKLAEEITRYQFFLQCKQDILHHRLPVHFELAVELFALAVQSELGDYDPQRHPDGYVGEFHFLAGQSAELERRVAQCHRTLAGQVPASAELNFLERLKWLDLYGCQLFAIQFDEGAADEYALGLNPSGVLVLRNKLRVAHYAWQRIVKSKCQGRCFLMDVIDGASGPDGAPAGSAPPPGRLRTSRFGFRLADKATSRRLRWTLEDHKGFYQLLRNSATLNQLAQQHQQQQAKLSQRFRQSIRSAIGVGAFAGASAQHQLSQQQQQKLRSSMKSLASQQRAELAARAPPTVVRMPSRRYGKSQSVRYQAGASGNGCGLPTAAHTMVESQRQQALMLMSQLNQLAASGHPALATGKSQTLRPTSSSARVDAREASKHPYYQMMLMMAANQQQHQAAPEVSIVPPGRHLVQPSIYKASSVVNGLNQLAGNAAAQGAPMAQLFGARAHYPGQHGHESPRSTKSAIAPSSALKLASRKLAKQQQQLLYGNQADGQPLLAYEPEQLAQAHMYALGQQSADYYGAYSNSANPSPRSVRSARVAAGRHRSKSTSDNLHLQHKQRANKMLLATANQQLPPPPNYQVSDTMRRQQQQQSLGRKKTTFALSNGQANLLLGAQAADERDYCCSRSDCSSLDESAQPRSLRPGQQQPQRRRRCRPGAQQVGVAQSACPDDAREWEAIRRRHSEFSSGKGNFLAGRPVKGEDANNNTGGSEQQPVRNMANKQATPILLSMSYEQANSLNSKAVQLLNLQRQQLNSQSGCDAANKSCSSAADSAASSVASSPKVATGAAGAQQRQSAAAKTAGDSTASSSTTSGYYAGTNSMGSASADSDGTGDTTKQPQKQKHQQPARNSRPSAPNYQPYAGSQWAEEGAGSRAKVALGAYAARMAGNRLLIGNQANFKPDRANNSTNDNNSNQASQQQFYLGETDSNTADEQPVGSPRSSGQQPAEWSALSQLQNAPSSLKYVSFDV